jgi:hypothetical protein
VRPTLPTLTSSIVSISFFPPDYGFSSFRYYSKLGSCDLLSHPAAFLMVNLAVAEQDSSINSCLKFHRPLFENFSTTFA